MEQSMSRLVSFGVLVGILVVIGVMFYQVMASFILPLFLATLLVVIFHPLHRWILQRTRNRNYVAALLTTIAVMVIVLAPAISICTFALIEASTALTQINVGILRDRLDETRHNLGLEMPQADKWRTIEASLENALLGGTQDNKRPTVPTPVPEYLVNEFNSLTAALRSEEIVLPEDLVEQVRAALANIQEKERGTIEYDAAVQEALAVFRQFKERVLGGPFWASVIEIANPSDEELREVMRRTAEGGRERIVSAAGDTTAFLGKTFVGLIIMVVAMFFFFADGPKMVEHVMQLTPLDRDYERELLSEFDKISRAVVVATLLSAVVQGLLAGVGYLFAGLESVFLLTLLTTVMAMVPIVGTALVWVPACLWLFFYEDRPIAALLLALYCAGVVSMIDNVIKPWVLHGQSRLHPLAALLSVLGGVQALGPIGILVGPMVFVFLATLLKILQRELTGMEKLPWASSPKKS